MIPERFDAVIDITATRKLSRYGFRISGCPSIARSGAGMMHGASRDTLLTLALCCALKTFTQAAIAKIRTQPRKLRILVRCSDKRFVTACGAVNTTTNGQHARAARTLWEELTREMARFSLRCECVDESALTATRDFACRVLPARTFPGGFPLPELVTA